MAAGIVFRAAASPSPPPQRRVRPAVWRSLRIKPGRPALRILPGWPLVLMYAGFPIWWLLGLANIGFVIVAIPMAYQLLKRRTIATPHGFGLWLLFLAWAAAGVLTLWADAPGAQPASGLGRLLPFGYRLLWYIAATIFLLYVGNMRERELPTRQIVRLLSWFFLVTVAGGYLGWILPHLEFSSVLELVLPHSITNIEFVRILIHPGAAQIQNIIGHESPRPKAPFSFANDWGANYGMLLPFFILSWLRYPSKWRRRLFPVVALAAIPPVIFSLNRGLWLGLIAMTGYAIIWVTVRGRFGAAVALVGAAVVVAGVVILSPLGHQVQERIANPHSNTGRERLASLAVQSTLEGSPVIGFGAPRAVQGNFFSIAGGATPTCPQCSPPLLGTQGHLLLLVFAHGFVGALWFLGFVYYRFFRGLRDPSPDAMAYTAVGVFFTAVMPVYDLVSAPLITLMLALGLLWRREQQARTTDETVTP